MTKSVGEVREVLERFVRCERFALAFGEKDIFPKEVPLGDMTKRQYLDGGSEAVRTWSQIPVVGGMQIEYRHHAWLGGIDVPWRASWADYQALIGFMGATSGVRGVERLRNRYEDLRLLTDGATARETYKQTFSWDDDDFACLLQCARHLAQGVPEGLTPREFAGRIPGVNAKWLDLASHKKALQLLLGTPLELVGRPRTMLVRWLDPTRLKGVPPKRYDVLVAGDGHDCPYVPSVVVIVENRDVLDHLDDIPGGVVVEGGGKAGMSCARELLWWLDGQPVFYVGDLDATGFEILSGYRQHGLDVASVLMDAAALRQLEHLGTNIATGKRPLDELAARDNLALTASELEAYHAITSPGWQGYRRIEQEAYIALTHEHIMRAIGQLGCSSS